MKLYEGATLRVVSSLHKGGFTGTVGSNSSFMSTQLYYLKTGSPNP